MSEKVSARERGRLKVQILAVLAIIPMVSLFVGELFNTFFNETKDLTWQERFLFSLKPTVYILSLVLVFFYGWMILRFLKPFFRYLEDGSEYDKARTATMKIPWFLLGVNSFFWILGTTIFYALYQWESPGGVPLSWGLGLKFSEGLFGAQLAIQLINNRMIRYKDLLQITSMRPGERDLYARQKNLIMIISISLLWAVHLLFGARYFVYRNPAFQGFSSFNGSLLTLSLILFLLSLLLYGLSRREYLYQMSHLAANLAGMGASEKADLSREVLIINFDEIGELAQAYNRLTGKLKEDFRRLQEIASSVESFSREVLDSASELSGRTEENAASTESVLSTLEEFTRLLEELRDRITGQKETLLASVESADKLSEGVKTIIDQSEEVRRQAGSNLSDAEQSVSSVTQSMGQTLKISSRVEEMVGKIRKAGEQTQSIDIILKGIEDISERTNLLSMNAAIEAARAGSTGRGFAVVAGEIRKLAETSSGAVKDIGDLIKSIKESVTEAVGLAERGLEESESGKALAEESEKTLNRIVESLKSTGGMIHGIAQATREQQNSASVVGEGAVHLKTFTEDIDEAVLQQTQGANQILGSMNEISRNNEEQARAAEALSRLADNLKGRNRDLSEIIRQFHWEEGAISPESPTEVPRKKDA